MDATLLLCWAIEPAICLPADCEGAVEVYCIDRLLLQRLKLSFSERFVVSAECGPA